MSRGRGGREEGVKRSCWKLLWSVLPLLLLLLAASTKGEGKELRFFPSLLGVCKRNLCDGGLCVGKGGVEAKRGGREKYARGMK